MEVRLSRSSQGSGYSLMLTCQEHRGDNKVFPPGQQCKHSEDYFCLVISSEPESLQTSSIGNKGIGHNKLCSL